MKAAALITIASLYRPQQQNCDRFFHAGPGEIRVLLLIDETLGWIMPLQFCVGPLLTAAEIVQ
jgi:hypothetical protein